MSNDDKGRFECYRELAELAFQSFNSRRAFEWKILLGFWAVMLAVYSPQWETPKLSGPQIFWTTAAFIFAWVWGVWIANLNDKERFDYYLKLAERETGICRDIKCKGKSRCECEPPNYPQKVSRLKATAELFECNDCFCKHCFIFDWNAQFQIIVTVALAYLLYKRQDEPAGSWLESLFSY